MRLLNRFLKKDAPVENLIEPLDTVLQRDVFAKQPLAKDVAEDFWSGEPEAIAAPVAVEEVTDLPLRNRRRRNATRILGFDGLDNSGADPFDQAPASADQKTMMFPVGWLTIVEGDGRGNSFCIGSGLNQIGRGEDNSIQLDFGDVAISRSNHFSLVYDDDVKKLILGHGGKSNIVRLNSSPVISNQEVFDGDRIKVGSTILVLKTLCDDTFDWAMHDTDEGFDHVAIA